MRHVNLNDFGQQAHYLAQAAADCTVSTAVLYRNNDSALPLIDLLERRGVPYACRQRESFFFTSPAVRDLTDVLRFALDGTDRERFLRIYYKLEVRVKRSVLQEKLRRVPEGAPVLDALIDGGGVEPWQTGRLKALRTHLSKLPQLSSFAALQRIVKYMGYGDYLSSQGATRAGWSCCWPWPGRSRGWRAFSAAWTPCGTRWRRGAATRPAPLCSPPSTPARAWSTTGCSSSTRWTAFSHR
ncbi:hypothetical protein M5E87_26135 [Flavonifractor plautii]|nr:hypothetical protein M5E87_26135 [Flavonifractor plautii]